jgi:hypothetical protein
MAMSSCAVFCAEVIASDGVGIVSAGYGPSTQVITSQPTTTVVTTVMSPMFRESPVQTVCPHCRAQVVTALQYETGTLAWLICAVVCIIGYIASSSSFLLPPLLLPNFIYPFYLILFLLLLLLFSSNSFTSLLSPTLIKTPLLSPPLPSPSFSLCYFSSFSFILLLYYSSTGTSFSSALSTSPFYPPPVCKTAGGIGMDGVRRDS